MTEEEIKRIRRKAMGSQERTIDYSKFITRPGEVADMKSGIVPLVTMTLLDNLFLYDDRTPLGGVPCGAQISVNGRPDSGKSILMQEIATRMAGSLKTLFVTTEDIFRAESPRRDLEQKMFDKAEAIPVDWGQVQDNLYIMDLVVHSELNNWEFFKTTYELVCTREKIQVVIIDSVTCLEQYSHTLKFKILELVRFNQRHGITGLFVNQRTEEKSSPYAVAGGAGMGHMLDVNIIIDHENIYDKGIYDDLGIKRGQYARFIKVAGSRLCTFDPKAKLLTITPNGFLRTVEEK